MKLLTPMKRVRPALAKASIARHASRSAGLSPSRELGPWEHERIEVVGGKVLERASERLLHLLRDRSFGVVGQTLVLAVFERELTLYEQLAARDATSRDRSLNGLANRDFEVVFALIGRVDTAKSGFERERRQTLLCALLSRWCHKGASESGRRSSLWTARYQMLGASFSTAFARGFAPWPSASRPGRCCPHDPIRKTLGEFVERSPDSCPSGNQRRMAIARRADGKLVIHNPIALDDAEMKEVEALGKPGFLVVPNAFHRQDAIIYKQRYPELSVLCPETARKRVSDIVEVAGNMDEMPKDTDVEMFHLRGMKQREGALRVRSQARQVPSCSTTRCSIWSRARGAAGFFMAPTGTLSVPRFARWMLVKKGRRAQRAPARAGQFARPSTIGARPRQGVDGRSRSRAARSRAGRL